MKRFLIIGAIVSATALLILWLGPGLTPAQESPPSATRPPTIQTAERPAADAPPPTAAGTATDMDTRVRQFLHSRRGQWRDMNIPASDGQLLHDLIVQNRYTRALEIGTSTGRSGIWIAWALSKTGGRLITIEIDAGRHAEAVANFRAAGLDGFIDARLGDAHQLVPALEGPFDFVFCDADKGWYRNYLEAVLPRLTVGGCFAAHNVSDPDRGGGGRGRGGLREFALYLKSRPDLETTFPSGSLAVSTKRAPAEK